MISASSRSHASAKTARSARSQWVCVQRRHGQGCPLHRPQQADTAFDLTIVQHDARRRDLDRRPAGLRVHQQDGARVVRTVQRLRQAERPIALPPADGEDLGLRAGLGMDIERRRSVTIRLSAGQRFDADVVGA